MIVPTLLVTGPVGVGKTTLIHEMGHMLGAAKVPHATVDFDNLTACYPRPAGDDQWGTQLGLANLTSIWRNYRAAGAERLLIARVVESRDELTGFERAIPGAEIVVVRLRAPVATLQERLRSRRDGRDMAWHLARAAELAPLMDEQRVEDFAVDTDGLHPTDLARDVLARVGWLR